MMLVSAEKSVPPTKGKQFGTDPAVCAEIGVASQPRPLSTPSVQIVTTPVETFTAEQRMCSSVESPKSTTTSKMPLVPKGFEVN